jgi:copper oxidase (laccase) domain-containing protein
MRSFIAALIVCTAADLSAAAQQPPAPSPQQPPAPTTPADPQAPPKEAPAPQGTRELAADAGLIFFPVKADKTADFEQIMAKLKEALSASEDPVRREQAAGWKVFKAIEPGPNNSTLYVFVIDPAVKGSDYAFWKTLYDSFPKEVQQLYRLYNAATAGGQTLLNLQLIQSFEPPR